MNEETLMSIKQQFDYTKNLKQRFADIDAYIAHLDEKFKRIQKRAMRSEIVMDLVSIELHELKARIDHLGDTLSQEKKH